MIASTTPWRQRAKFRPLSVFGMAGVWVLVWGSLSPLVVLSGVALGWIIGMLFPLPPISGRGGCGLSGSPC